LTTAIFVYLGGYFFRNVRDNITWRYVTSCRPVVDYKMNDREWLFHFFGQQGCRMLTFVLARLSCYK